MTTHDHTQKESAMTDEGTRKEVGPCYNVPLIKSMPMSPEKYGPCMRQAMPSRDDLVKVKRISERTVAGYEVLLNHYVELKAELDAKEPLYIAREGSLKILEHDDAVLRTERDNLKAQLAAVMAERDQLQSQHVQLMRAYDPNCDEYHFDEQIQSMNSARRIVDAMQDLAEGLGRDPEGNLSDIDDEALGRIQDLEAERDQLAEKVASDAEDAEVGRLVRSIVGQDTDILRIYHWADGEYEYVDETHEGNEEGYTCNEQWGDTLLEALQALSQGGEA